ncbi:MAG: LacI family DNA-binding transcriptional regulator [Ktedonobacteraceae bacterium]|nr:LacI family DNA-binding transcriptional regulator [Ktedonobacteraceae bacterium]MBO0793800.1 LacI family DNA-binding transcriptional regulator [Ktedonobacteraceae bacterium]
MRTIHDVAKAAGVSITTVSRALNGYSDVSESTRRRVMRIAKELGYRPNAAARNLRVKRTGTIAFAPCLPKRIDAKLFFKEFIGMLAFDCFQHNLSLLVTLPYSDQYEPEMYQELAGTGRVDGIILATVQPQDMRIPLLQKMGVPFVAFGRLLDDTDLSYPFVDVDGKAGVGNLVDYLYAQGHCRIAYLSDFLEASYIYYRWHGYQEALRKHGLVEDERLLVMGVRDQEGVSAAVARMLALPAEHAPTALVTSNNQLALCVLSALRDLGRSVGKESGQVAVASFDDLPFAAYVEPALTTARQPMVEVSQLVLELLVSILKREELDVSKTAYPHLHRLGAQQFLLESELVIRDSA